MPYHIVIACSRAELNKNDIMYISAVCTLVNPPSRSNRESILPDVTVHDETSYIIRAMAFRERIKYTTTIDINEIKLDLNTEYLLYFNNMQWLCYNVINGKLVKHSQMSLSPITQEEILEVITAYGYIEVDLQKILTKRKNDGKPHFYKDDLILKSLPGSNHWFCSIVETPSSLRNGVVTFAASTFATSYMMIAPTQYDTREIYRESLVGLAALSPGRYRVFRFVEDTE